MSLHDKANQASEDITKLIEGCQRRLNKLRASHQTPELHAMHAEGMIEGLELALELLKSRVNS